MEPGRPPLVQDLRDDQRAKVRAQGAAGRGVLRGPVEFTVEIGPRQGGSVVIFDGPLGQASATASALGIRRVARAASPADLVEAPKSASALNALQQVQAFPGTREVAVRALASL